LRTPSPWWASSIARWPSPDLAGDPPELRSCLADATRRFQLWGLEPGLQLVPQGCADRASADRYFSEGGELLLDAGAFFSDDEWAAGIQAWCLVNRPAGLYAELVRRRISPPSRCLMGGRRIWRRDVDRGDGCCPGWLPGANPAYPACLTSFALPPPGQALNRPVSPSYRPKFRLVKQDLARRFRFAKPARWDAAVGAEPGPWRRAGPAPVVGKSKGGRLRLRQPGTPAKFHGKDSTAARRSVFSCLRARPAAVGVVLKNLPGPVGKVRAGSGPRPRRP